MKTLILTTTFAITALTIGANAAQAGQFSGGYSGYGYSGFAYGGSVAPRTTYGGDVHHNVNPWVNPGNGHYDWHNTSHFDYQPARTVQHYNHFDYQPGRYIPHQTGHYDLHH